MILKAARINAGFSQSEVGKLLNVSKSTVSRWETGETPITDELKEKLAQLYQLDSKQIELKKERSNQNAK